MSTMDNLLYDFDPLHSRSGRSEQLFPSVAASSTLTFASRSSAATMANHVAASAASLPSKPVSMVSAPLDLLSLDDDDIRNDTPANVVAGPSTSDAVLARAQQQRQGILSELAHAEQIPGWHTGASNTSRSPITVGASAPSLSQSALSTSPQTGSFSPSTSRGPRKTSTGFSPPRRMSRSGLMYDEHGRQSLRGGLAGSPTTSASAFTFSNAYSSAVAHNDHEVFPGSTLPRSRVSSGVANPVNNNLIDLGPHVLSNSTSTREPVEPEELLHPSSPPPGSALESMRSSSYFGGIGRTNSFKPLKFNSHEPEGHRLLPFDTSNGFRATPDSTAEQASTSQVQVPRLTVKRKQPSKEKTFDFSKAFSESSCPSDISPSQPSEQTNGMAPSHPIAIDTEPLLSIVLKPWSGLRNSILTDDVADGIRTGFTSRLRLQKSWSLLYSLDAHGTSLATLYSRVQTGLSRNGNGCVLCVRDMCGRTFGAYVSEAFKRQDSYYGNGDCFLWKIESFPPEETFRVGPIIRIYRWTGRNNYMVLSDSHFLSVGGGDGKFGLWMDANLDKGFSTTCPAFNNDVLCDKTGSATDGTDEGKFEIMGVECWAVD